MCVDVDYSVVGNRTPNWGRADALFCFSENSLLKGSNFQMEVDRERQGLREESRCFLWAESSSK